MKKIIITLLIVVNISGIYAQDFDNYQPIVCHQEIPSEILNPDKLLTFSLGTEIKPGDSYQSIKNKKKFIEITSFYFENFLRSGDLMFNNELSDYVNQVADNVLKNFPEVRQNLHFFVTKYPEVNAACLSNGVVIVNIGLLAQLENEAQLAYIIAHEAVHFVKKHGINSYLESLVQMKNKTRGGYFSNEKRIFAMLQYSKDLEFEADDQGFEQYFVQSGYRLSEAERVCDVLLYSDFPVDEIEFLKSEILDSNFNLAGKFWLDSVEPINVIEDYDDSEMSHPNIKKRRDRIIEKIAAQGDRGQKYLLGKDRFLQIRQIARFELCQLYLQQKKFPEAIYLTYILQKEFPNSVYLNRIKSAAYYGLTLFNNRGYSGKLIKSAKVQKGESQRFFHLLRVMKKSELNVLCAREIWKSHLKNPTDSFITQAFEFVLGDVFSHGYYNTSFFKLAADEKKSIEGDAMPADSLDNDRESSKYTKIKDKNNKATAITEEPFAKAFLSFANDEDFLTIYNRAKNKYKSSQYDSEVEYYSSYKKKKKKKQGKYIHEPINKIIIFNPLYFEIAANKKRQNLIFKSNIKRPKFISSIKKAAQYSGIQSELLDVNQFSAADVEKYNDYQTINTWVNELSIPDEFENSVDADEYENDSALFLTPNIEKIKAMCDKYNTHYVARTGVLKVVNNKLPIFTYSGVFSIYTLPLSIIYACLPRAYYYYYFSVYDLYSGQLVYSESAKMTSNPTELALESKLFNSFRTIQK